MPDKSISVGDVILVPESEGGTSNIVKKYVGGYATVNRICTGIALDGSLRHYITVQEHTCYKEYCWEDFLVKLQEKLKDEYNRTQWAYVKPL